MTTYQATAKSCVA